MTYVMADIHGCYDQFMEMLDTIEFTDRDMLFVLGDVIDRGEDGIELLNEMMLRVNIIPILGNHEYMAYRVLKELNVEVTEDNHNKHLDADTVRAYQEWMADGGMPTAESFSKLDAEEKEMIIEYLEEFGLYEEVTVDGKNFLLVHSVPEDFDGSRELSDYDAAEVVFGRCDYTKSCFVDKILVTGHTPTFGIGEEWRGKIYRENNHIALDCGAVYGEKLGCICLDTMEEFYV